MLILDDNDEQILRDFLNSYKECFEAMNTLLCKVMPKVKDLTKEEAELANTSDMKYKNMIYHVRKWNSKFKPL